MASKDGKAGKRRSTRPGSGFSIVASFWLWGALFFYAPVYLGITTIVFNVLGIICVSISLGGAGVELAKVWKNEALSYWGVGFLFLTPAVALHIVTARSTFSLAFGIVAKILVLILCAFSGPFFFLGVPYLFLPAREQHTDARSSRTSSEEPTSEGTKKDRIKFVGALIVALLSIATAIIKFSTALSP